MLNWKKIISDIQTVYQKELFDLSCNWPRYYKYNEDRDKITVIGNNKAKELSIALKKNKFIKKVRLSSHDISDRGFKSLLKCNLDSLCLTCNEIKGGSYLVDIHIQNLYLDANPINEEGAKYLSQANGILSLGISEPHIGNVGANHIFNNKHIQFLDMSSNYLTDDALKNVIQSENLQELVIYQNEFTRAGIVNLSFHNNIRKLDLTSCDIHDDCVLLLNKMPSLEALVLMCNYITLAGLKELFLNSNLQDINLYSNDINIKEGDVLPSNNSLIKLCLSNNKINGKSILVSFINISTLEVLELSHTNLLEESAVYLFENAPPSLQKLDVYCNPIRNIDLIKKCLNMTPFKTLD